DDLRVSVTNWDTGRRNPKFLKDLQPVELLETTTVLHPFQVMRYVRGAHNLGQTVIDLQLWDALSRNTYTLPPAVIAYWLHARDPLWNNNTCDVPIGFYLAARMHNINSSIENGLPMYPSAPALKAAA